MPTHTLYIIAQAVILVFTRIACMIGLKWDLPGASWAFLISQTLNAVYFFILVRQTIATTFTDLVRALIPGLKLNGLLFLVLLISDYLLNSVLVLHPAVYLLLMALIGLLFYAGIFS